MKCTEKVGFLLLHECGNISETRCIYCGKHLCNQHTYALTQDMVFKLSQIPPANVKTISCLECFRNNKIAKPETSQNSDNMQKNIAGTPNQNNRNNVKNPDNDPDYRYPYFGGYMPYMLYSGFNNNDRQVFNSPGYGTSDSSSDMLDS